MLFFYAMVSYGKLDSFFLFAAITQQETNEFDLFLSVLRDTTFPVESRSWQVPGEGDEENPLSLETILVLMPGLDSSFVLNFVYAYALGLELFGEITLLLSITTVIFSFGSFGVVSCITRSLMTYVSQNKNYNSFIN